MYETSLIEKKFLVLFKMHNIEPQTCRDGRVSADSIIRKYLELIGYTENDKDDSSHEVGYCKVFSKNDKKPIFRNLIPQMDNQYRYEIKYTYNNKDYSTIKFVNEVLETID